MSNKSIKQKNASNVVYGLTGNISLPSYALSKALNMPGIERNHVIPKVFFDKGPLSSRHLGMYVPIMPLGREEHRGSTFSFHNMKDGQRVPGSSGEAAFEGCGLNSYLFTLGLKVKGAPFYTANEVSLAIEVCRKYHAHIGLGFVADAIAEFRREFYDPLYAS